MIPISIQPFRWIPPPRRSADTMPDTPRGTGMRLAFLAGTWFGAGYAPRAPGTLAALTALPIHWALMRMPHGLEPALIAVLTLAGIWAGQKIARALGAEDPQIVVIDEVAGALIALWLASGHGVSGDLIALGLFRLFDIFKPWPVSAMEHLPHAGMSIMLDDVVAGLIAGLFVYWF